MAIRRDGKQVSGKFGDVVISSGDFLVLALGDDYKSRTNIRKNFLILTGLEPESRINGWRAWFSIGGFLITIAFAASGRFISPYGYHTNFMKIGVPISISIVCALFVLVFVPVFFRLVLAKKHRIKSLTSTLKVRVFLMHNFLTFKAVLFFK